MPIIEKAWMRSANGRTEVFLTSGGREFSSSVSGEAAVENLEWIVGKEPDFKGFEQEVSSLPKEVSLAVTQCLAKAQARTKLWRLFSQGTVNNLPMPAVVVLEKKDGIKEFFVFPKFAGGMNEALKTCNTAYRRFMEIPKNPKDDLKVFEILSQIASDNNCSIGVDGEGDLLEGAKKAFGTFVLERGSVIQLSDFSSVTKALEAVIKIKESGKGIIVADSADSLDSFSADFAVGVGAALFKGSLGKKEGIIKFNRLLDIALEIGEKVKWAELPY
ncbi:MAG: hypothetical protein HY362_01005 [Candidatus Aenigmarchaeota archaeon]|nr:hypothetical protein [Candidatus Aenigmarchaeota archaeon]